MPSPEKRLLPSYDTEMSGEIAIEQVANEAGWIIRKPAGQDVGVDLELEPKHDGVPSGLIIKAQAKAGLSYFERDDGTRFAFRADQKDINYWRRINTPLLLAIYSPKERAVYALEFHAYCRTRSIENDRLIWFDRKRDLLTVDKLRAVEAQLVPKNAATARQVLKRPLSVATISERLHTNLLLVREAPEWLHHARQLGTDEETKAALRGKAHSPCVSWKGELWSFADPRDETSGLSSAVDLLSSKRLDANAWFATRDGEIRCRNLLYAHLRGYLRSKGLVTDAKRRLFFPSLDGQIVDKSFQSVKVASKRKVAWPSQRRGNYWIHRALEAQFVWLGRSWHLALRPTFILTLDGRQAMPAPPGTIGGMVAHDYNDTVFRLLVFWHYVLFQGRSELSIGCGNQRMRFVASFLEGQASFGISGDHIDLWIPVQEEDIEGLYEAEEVFELGVGQQAENEEDDQA